MCPLSECVSGIGYDDHFSAQILSCDRSGSTQNNFFQEGFLQALGFSSGILNLRVPKGKVTNIASDFQQSSFY